MKKKDISEMGEEGFPDQYWDLNYDEPETMDCIGNVEEHMNYLKSLFDLELIEIRSLVDFGFGQGHMLRGALEAFRPRKSLGIEPSLRPFLRISGSTPQFGPLCKHRFVSMTSGKWSSYFIIPLFLDLPGMILSKTSRTSWQSCCFLLNCSSDISSASKPFILPYILARVYFLSIYEWDHLL